MEAESGRCYILTETCVDTREGCEIRLFAVDEAGPLLLRFTRQEPLFFLRREDRALPAGARRAALELTSLAGEPLDGIYFSSLRGFLQRTAKLAGTGRSSAGVGHPAGRALSYGALHSPKPRIPRSPGPGTRHAGTDRSGGTEHRVSPPPSPHCRWISRPVPTARSTASAATTAGGTATKQGASTWSVLNRLPPPRRRTSNSAIIPMRPPCSPGP